MKVLIIDCLTMGEGRRSFSRDFIGGGPKLIAGIIDRIEMRNKFIKIIRAEEILFGIENPMHFLGTFDICLISAMSMDMNSARKVLNSWRKANFGKIVIIGGPIASDPHLLKKIKCNIVVTGEGEKKIIQIFNILKEHDFKFDSSAINDLKNVRGISILDSGRIFKTNPSQMLSMEEYDLFSDPTFSIKHIKHYNNYSSARIYVECLRGCSNFNRMKFPLNNVQKCLDSCNNCTGNDLKNRINCPQNIPPGCGFCSTISTFGSVKSRRESHIISEIKGIIIEGARRIVLGGSDFLDYKREELVDGRILTTPVIPPEPNYLALNNLINEIIEIKVIKDEKAQIFIENIKASLCTNRALEILSKIPNCVFSVGCETASEEFAERLGRPFGSSETLKTVKNAINFGIRVHVYFIHGLPGEKIKYLEESIDLINEFYKKGVEKITIYKYQDFPGAPFHSLQNKETYIKQNVKKLRIYRKKLVKLAINFNRMRKEEMVGNNYRIILAEKSFHDKSDAIGYMICGGPKVIVKNATKYMGQFVDVRIQRALSDKLIEGKIVKRG